MSLYTEPINTGYSYRKEILSQFEGFIEAEFKDAIERQRDFFRPDFSSIQAYTASVEQYRDQFRRMLGWPLTSPPQQDLPAVREMPVAEDELGRISRIWIETLPGLETYGLLFLPNGDGPFPLVISLHGGEGTPELCSGLPPSGSANYNDMTRRVLRRGFAVFAPQLLMWLPEKGGPAYNRQQILLKLSQLGGSIHALEIVQLQRVIDSLSVRECIDISRIGITGVSYGGIYALYLPAVDLRIKAVVASSSFHHHTVEILDAFVNCGFDDFFKYDEYKTSEFVMYNSANTFQGAEIAGLVCPRPLYIEVGEKEEEFWPLQIPRAEAERAMKIYQKLGVPKSFRYKEHEGGHEFNKADDGIQFLCDHLLDS